MKTILYIHQYFKTEEEGGALRSYFIAKELVENGYRVQMITSHNQSRYRYKNIEGIEIHYLPIKYSNRMSFGRRYLAFLKFVYQAIRLLPKLPKYNLVYSSSTPLTVGLIAIWIKWKLKIPYIFEVRDLWPKAPIQMRVLKSKAAVKLAKIIEKKIYTHAETIIALSPGIASDIKTTCAAANVLMIPNMADTKFFQTSEPSPSKFTIGYFGALGLANNLESILEIASISQQYNLKVKFVIAGDGAKLTFLEERISSLKLDNIKIQPVQNRQGIKKLMHQTHACLTSFLKLPVLETNSPNKFFDGLAAGKLCIVNTKGWLQNLVENHQCGIYIDPENPDTFPEKIHPFLNDKSLLIEYQQNARKLAENEFSREKLVEQVCEEVTCVLANT